MIINKKLVGCLLIIAILLASLIMGSFAQEESILDQILKRGTVRVAMVLVSNPMMGFKNEKGEPTGFEYDIAMLLAEKLGVKLEVVECMSGSTRIPTLQAKKVDIIIAGLTRSLERAKSVAYMDVPYYMSGFKLIVRPDSPYKTLEDLQANEAKLKVGIDRGGMAEQWAAKLFPNAQVLRFESIPDAYLALGKGLIDVMGNDAIAANFQEAANPGKFKNVPGVLGTEEIAAAVAYGDFKWWSWCNLFFHEFNAYGENKRLYTKYVGSVPEQIIDYTEIK